MKFKKLIIVLVVLIPLLFVCNSAYAGWIEGKIVKATQDSNGEIIIKFFRNSNSTEINAYVLESLSQTSKNAILAIALTAASMDAGVDVFYNWDNSRIEKLAIFAP